MSIYCQLVDLPPIGTLLVPITCSICLISLLKFKFLALLSLHFQVCQSSRKTSPTMQTRAYSVLFCQKFCQAPYALNDCCYHRALNVSCDWRILNIFKKPILILKSYCSTKLICLSKNFFPSIYAKFIYMPCRASSIVGIVFVLSNT